jgi:bacterioferritin-associated ferredoxin
MTTQTQLPFFNASFTYQQGEDFFQVQLDIDNHDRIADVGYKTLNPQYALSMEKLIPDLMEKNITDIQANNPGLFNIPAITLKLALEDFTGEINQTFSDMGKQPSQIICRCKAIDKPALVQCIDKHEAKREEVIKECHVSQICGRCQPQFEQALEESPWRQHFFADKPNIRWIQDIERAMERWQDESVPKLAYSLIRYQNNRVKLRANGERDGWKRHELTEKVQHYLRERIHPEINVSLVF